MDSLLPEVRMCKTCGESKSISCFEQHKHTCKPCRTIQKKESAIKRNEINGIPEGKPCSECNKSFSPNDFQFRLDTQSYKGICNECFNKKQYYQTYRENKRLENEEEYLKHNAVIAKNYRDLHPEIKEEYNENRKKDINLKLNSLKSSAKKRGINWCIDDETEMANKLIMPCTYCGETIEENNNNLHGLDRIHNNIGYTNENTVSACTMCNMMKSTYTVEEFQNKIFKCATYMSNTSNVIKSMITTQCIENLKEKTFAVNNEINNNIKPKLVHHKNEQCVAFINIHTNDIAHISNTLKDACDMVQITSPSGCIKIKNPNTIWVNPHWTVRKIERSKVSISETENILFLNALEIMNKNKNKSKYYIKDANNVLTPHSSINNISRATKIHSKTLNRLLMSHNYLNENAEIDLSKFPDCNGLTLISNL